MQKTYSPDIGGNKDDDRERAEPGVTDGETNVTRYVRSGEVPKR